MYLHVLKFPVQTEKRKLGSAGGLQKPGRECVRHEQAGSYLIIRDFHTADGKRRLEVGKAQQWRPGAAGNKLKERWAMKYSSSESSLLVTDTWHFDTASQCRKHSVHWRTAQAQPLQITGWAERTVFTLRNMALSSGLKSLPRMSHSQMMTR